MKSKHFAVFIALACVAINCLAVSCYTGPIVVPDSLTPAELIQRGQEASDKNRYNHALQYYSALIERFPFDTDNTLAAEYEIGFIHYKQKNYNLAKTELNDLISRYNVPDGELLPAQFKILSGIILGKIEEVENSRKKRN